MDETTTLDAETEAAASAPSTESDPVDEAVEDELLIEEVSIDGMCGVY